MTSVLIRGDGVAARCCAHLLVRSGFSVSVERTTRPRLPAIMLGIPAQQLIRDIFGRDELFRDLPPICKRIVAWGPSANPIALDHSAVVVSEEVLLDRLGAPPEPTGRLDPAWTVLASPPLPAAANEHRFGSRIACAMPVELKDTAEPAACWIESLAEGWLFLVANAPRSGWLLSLGLHPEELLGQSAVVRDRIAQVDSPTAQFAASPRVVVPLAGPGWIACGTAAMAFDPICGDGTAHAVREAILASAVIGAATRGEDIDALLSHYEARLIGGFRRHLVHCFEYYASGRGGPWWHSESESVARGIDWCSRRMNGYPNFRYRLNGLELQAIG
jgi:hypothetical protein